MKETKEKESMPNYTMPMADLTDKALKNCEQALRTGLKMQEEAGRWWTSMFNQTTLTQDWQKRFGNMTGMASSLMPMAQRRMEEVMSLVEKNNKTGTELMQKAVDAAQTRGVAECQAKWLDFWTSSLGAVRANAEAVSELSSKAIDSWIEFVRKNTELTEVRAPKAA
jgi:hypothetical protein